MSLAQLLIACCVEENVSRKGRGMKDNEWYGIMTI